MRSYLVLCVLSLVLINNCGLAVDSSTAAPGKDVPASSPSPPTPAPVPVTNPPAPGSSTNAPTPAPTPKPIIASQPLKFNLTDKEVVCALFSFTGTIRLQTKADEQESDVTVYLLNNTQLADGSLCSANQTILNLNINGTSDLLTLELEHSGSTYKLNRIALSIGGAAFETTEAKFNIDDTKSYLCLAETNYKLNKTNVKEGEKEVPSAHLKFTNLNIDAFRSSKDNEFRQAIQCEADYPTNDFVPLAVGCALISLVLIVLIAYIVGRRRSKRLAYTSV